MNKRLYPRIKLQLIIFIHTLTQKIPATAIDISEEGLGILVDKEYIDIVPITNIVLSYYDGKKMKCVRGVCQYQEERNGQLHMGILIRNPDFADFYRYCLVFSIKHQTAIVKSPINK